MMVEQHFMAYEVYHQNGRNKLYHYLGIPLIVYAVLNFLYQIPHLNLEGFGLDFALLFYLAVLCFYLALSPRLALAMTVLTAPLYLLARFTPWTAGLAAFTIGWIFQIVGHHYEGKRPAFLTNAVHLLIGPLWIVSHLLEKLGLWKPRPATP